MIGLLALASPALFLTGILGIAQQPAAKQSLPDGLKHVPADALGFIHIRVGDFLKSDVGVALLEELRKDREASKGLKKIEQILRVEADGQRIGFVIGFDGIFRLASLSRGRRDADLVFIQFQPDCARACAPRARALAS